MTKIPSRRCSTDCSIVDERTVLKSGKRKIDDMLEFRRRPSDYSTAASD